MEKRTNSPYPRIDRPILAVVVNLLILIAGVQAIRTLNVRQYPHSENAAVTVTTTGAPAPVEGSAVITMANGSPAFGQYKPAPGGGWEPWSLQVVEIVGDRISGITFFLDTARFFPLFGLPPRIEA